MKILVGKTFGIGNAILAVPMVKALSTLGHVDVLVGSTPDDFGASEVFANLKVLGFIDNIFIDRTDTYHDVAIMAIPFDNRWVNGIDYRAARVLDGRKRPENVERLGFDMWKKHEIEYQMENAIALGYSGETPGSSFLQEQKCSDMNLVYVGVGFKRDTGGFGLSKHWGSSRYVRFIESVAKINAKARFISTGNMRDIIESCAPIVRLVGSDLYSCLALPLSHSLFHLNSCAAYFGNDTGMMHAAASTGMPTFGMMAYPDLAVKNPPFGSNGRAVVFDGDSPSPEDVASQFVDFVWGIK